MWFLMIISYVLMFVSGLLLILSGLQGHLLFDVLGRYHITFSIFVIIVYVFTETLILFFFITLSKKIKEIMSKNSINDVEAKKFHNLRSKLFKYTSLNLLIIGSNFILGAGVHTLVIPLFIHTILFYLGLVHYFLLVKIQHLCFKEFSDLIIRVNDRIVSKF